MENKKGQVASIQQILIIAGLVGAMVIILGMFHSQIRTNTDVTVTSSITNQTFTATGGSPVSFGLTEEDITITASTIKVYNATNQSKEISNENNANYTLNTAGTFLWNSSAAYANKSVNFTFTYTYIQETAVHNATTQGLGAMETGSSWLGIVVVAVIGAVIILFIMSAFGKR